MSSNSKQTARDKYLTKKYGITQAIYLDMVKYGDGKCWICKKKPKPGKALNVDHDHKTLQVRGTLCFFCNKYMIGRRRREHVYLFLRAAEYLASTKDWRQHVSST